MKSVIQLFLVSLIFLGCSDGLSRKEAFNMLKEQYPQKLYHEIHTLDPIEAIKVQKAGLVEMGLVTVNNNAGFQEKRIFFTDKSKDLLAPTPGSEKMLLGVQRVKTGEWNLKEVTGISISGNKATVEYTHEISEITPFAKLYRKPPVKGEVQKNKAHFIKYDDGWRIEK